MLQPVKLLAAADALTDYWSPRIVGSLNENYVKVAKVKGEFVWHKHDDEDEFFLVLRGELAIELEHDRVVLQPGDFYVVPKNTLHKPIASDECCIALLEPKATKHTGDTVTALTRSVDEQLGVA